MRRRRGPSVRVKLRNSTVLVSWKTMSSNHFNAPLEHVTAPRIAEIILKSKVFSVDIFSIQGDQCINMFAPGVSRRQHLHATGATIKLTWDGPVMVIPDDSSYLMSNLPTNTLIDNRAHRVFVRPGSHEKRLRAVGVKFSRWALDEWLELEGWRTYLPKRLRDGILARRRLDFRRKIRSLIQEEPLFIAVVLGR
jgi:hypothetical protein